MADSVFNAKATQPGSHREILYPMTSEVEVVAGASAWSGSYEVLPVNTFDSEYMWGAGGDKRSFYLVGIRLNSSANPTNPATLQLFRVIYLSATALNALSGNGQGDDSLIKIADTSGFLVGDIVWVMDDTTTDGQIGQVDVIDPNVSLDITDSLAVEYDHGDGGKVYLIDRPGVVGYGGICNLYAAANAKEDRSERFHNARKMAAGDGVVARAYGMGGTNTLQINLILGDEMP